MRRVRERKSWALEHVQDTRREIMNLSSENPEDQYWSLDILYHSRDEWKIALEGSMKEYLFVSPDVGSEYDHVFEEFDETFRNINPDDREKWLSEVLCLYIMEYVDVYQSRISYLLSLMKARPDRYDNTIAQAFRSSSNTIMEMPQKWIPFCEVFGHMVCGEFVRSGFEQCNPCPVLMTLIVAFESNAGTEGKSQLIHGAARAVIQLSKVTAKYISGENWDVRLYSRRTNLEHDVSPDRWQEWIMGFEAFGNGEPQGSGAGADALRAAEVMRG